MNSATGTILIVDDTPQNISLLFDYLGEHGFELLVAEDGNAALKIVQQEPPDLVLLDVMMPGIDGFETCRQMKQLDTIKDIPVIFMTALSDVNDKVNGFNAGAVDYVTKPLQHEEVLARINTHLTLRKLQYILQEQNERLITLNQEKNEFLGIAAHDLKNPLGSIFSLSEFTLDKFETLNAEKLKRNLNIIKQSAQQMTKLVSSLLEVNMIDEGKIEVELRQLDIHFILQNLLTRYSPKAQEKNIQIETSYPDIACIAMLDEMKFIQVLDNLISNAIKYSPPNKVIFVHLTHEGQHIRCQVKDQGPGLSEEDRAKLFGKFTRLTPRPTAGESSTGLGLFIVKKLVDAMHGKVWCSSELGVGTRFFIEFPAVVN